MSDDEGEVLFGDDSDEKRVEYDLSDTTTSVPHPCHFVLVVPQEMAGAPFRIVTLPHPKHRGDALFALSSTGELLELQEHRRRFATTWFVGDTVEPSSGLFMATPIDHTFFALAASRIVTPGQDHCFVAADELLRRNVAIDNLPASTRTAISKTFDLVCDTRNAGGDDYFRYSEAKFLEWVKRKHPLIATSDELKGALQTSDDSVLEATALELLAEYIDPALKALVSTACGVQAVASHALPMSASHWELKQPSEGPAKKPRVEVKSSPAVRRLEKGGPPKGTPTLMAMFAKKQQQAPPK